MTVISPLRRLAVASAVSIVMLFAAATAAQAATFTVNTTADNAPSSGECSGGTSDCSLRQAIDKANTTAGDDTVALPAGHYTLTIPGTGEDADQTGDLDITGSAGAVTSGALTLTGAGARSTTIDGGGIDRVLHVVASAGSSLPAGSATISGVTITGGVEPNDDGGGGIQNEGVLSLDASVVTDNSSEYGGGIHTTSNSTGMALLVSNSTISANTATGEYGGGMDFDGGDGRIVNTSIVNNVVQRSYSADAGGAMEIDDGNLTFSNDTIAYNRATAAAGSPALTSADAGGVELYGASSYTTPVFENTIIAENSPSDCHIRNQGSLPRAGVNLDSDSTCFNGPADKHADPLLGQLQNNGGQTDTLALLDGSPAINAADNSLAPATDQRGIARPQPAGGNSDIGAYEATPPIVATAAASGVSPSSATLNGTVNPDNLATTYHFEYGTTTSYGSSSPAQSAGADYANHPESAGITGLKAHTTYHFRIVATNAVGTSYGADQFFTTSGKAPAAKTGGATKVGSRSATVHGTVNPNGVATRYHFDYGTTTHYGKSTSSRSAGSGTKSRAVARGLSGLRPGAIYHYRVVAVSAAGRKSGGDRTLRTKAAISVAGVSASSCVRAGSTRLRVRVASVLRPGVTVSLDGRRIAGGKGRSFSALARLRSGRHRLTVVARSGAGTTRRVVSFRVCGAPRFTG